MYGDEIQEDILRLPQINKTYVLFEKLHKS